MPTDVPGWLAAVGVSAEADWRIEVELRGPRCPATVSQCLYLHHLIGHRFFFAGARP
jgi:hypothetical protein